MSDIEVFQPPFSMIPYIYACFMMGVMYYMNSILNRNFELKNTNFIQHNLIKRLKKSNQKTNYLIPVEHVVNHWKDPYYENVSTTYNNYFYEIINGYHVKDSVHFPGFYELHHHKGMISKNKNGIYSIEKFELPENVPSSWIKY